MQYTIQQLEDWNTVLDQIIPLLISGKILTLSGPLGAGKTTFTQLLAQRLGSISSPKSPTFALLREHRLSGKVNDLKRFIHVDAYRLEYDEDVMSLNLEEELAEQGTLVVIEWPEKMVKWIEKRKERVIGMVIRVDGGVRQVETI
jgi:tRNA threonylcarbamoyladenosine biosynthesis protein TsaE